MCAYTCTLQFSTPHCPSPMSLWISCCLWPKIYWTNPTLQANSYLYFRHQLYHLHYISTSRYNGFSCCSPKVHNVPLYVALIGPFMAVFPTTSICPPMAETIPFSSLHQSLTHVKHSDICGIINRSLHTLQMSTCSEGCL